MRILGVLVALAAGSCGGTGPEPVLVPPAGWSVEDGRLPDDTDAAVAQAALELRTTGLRRSFWPREPGLIPELSAQGFVVSDGPCGPTVSAWVKVVPADHPVLAAERAVELDADGAIVAEWPLPLYSVVGGIEADRLLVPLQFAEDPSAPVPAISIARDGTLRVIAIVPTREPELFPCPALSRYGDSAYLRCMVLVDRSSQKRRSIAYQLPCT